MWRLTNSEYRSLIACGSKPVSATWNDTRSVLFMSAAAAESGSIETNAMQAATTQRPMRAVTPDAIRARDSQQLFDRTREVLRFDVRRVALDDIAFRVDEKLREIPFD